MRLHGSVGPARTTIKAVAEEAGVQRATVYRHFPDEASLFEACSSHWRSLNPPPDPRSWSGIADPDQRLESALRDVYRWYEWAEPMLTRTTRDAPLVAAMAKPVAAGRAWLQGVAAALMEGRPERGRRRERVGAVIHHALEFPTWRSLVVEHGLSRDDAVELMARLVTAA